MVEKKCSHAVVMPHEYDTVALKALFALVQRDCVSSPKKNASGLSDNLFMKPRYTGRCAGLIFYTSKLIVSLKPWKKIMKERGHAFIIDAGVYCNTRLPKEAHESPGK